MRITVKRPSGSIDVITDLTVLQETQRLSKRLEEFDAQQSKDLTETQMAARVKTRKRMVSSLQKAMKQADAVTLRFTLEGLNYSRWEYYCAQYPLDKSLDVDQRTSNMAALAKNTFLEMVTAVAWADGHEPVEMDESELEEFFDSLADSQVLEVMNAIQRLNVPATKIPKVA